MTSLLPSTVKNFIFNVAQTHYVGGLPAVVMMNATDLKICFTNAWNEFGSYVTAIDWR